jgi:hypothetical protein
MLQRIEVGRIYRHFKGDFYFVEDIATHSETRESLVIYRALYGNHKLYARPLEMFAEELDEKRQKKFKQQYRFELQDIKSVARN